MKRSPASSRPLDERTRALLARAIRKVPGLEANAAIDRERLRQELVCGHGLSYEVVLAGEKSFSYLANTVAPRLAHYLGEKKIPIPRATGVFVSLFTGEDLYLIEATTFFEAVREAEGVDEMSWRGRLRSWQSG